MSVSAKALAHFHRRLHEWYRAHGRKDLPWRNTEDAYHIYLSEIMLQQTQVKTVRERFYGPFLKKFPTLEALAKARQDDVLKAWQGLGYYNRAIHLHEAAKRCGGTMPKTVEELLALPGIGRNTAHAIAAFAHHQPVAVMEANVKRVVSRMFALASPDEKTLWEKAEALLDQKSPFDYNQAMMDIGAMVCLKRAPECGSCPASAMCAGKASPESYPAAKQKKAVPVREKSIFVLRNPEKKYFARPRESRFLNGLYHFEESDSAHARGKYLGHVRQQYSHFTLEAKVHLVESEKRGKNWYTLAELKKLPMSMAEQKILKLIGS
jgi:A/G-specific adenine glycosylase